MARRSVGLRTMGSGSGVQNGGGRLDWAKSGAAGHSQRQSLVLLVPRSMPPQPANIHDRLGRDARESEDHDGTAADKANPKDGVGTPGLGYEQSSHDNAREDGEAEANPSSGTTLHRYASPLLPEGTPYRRIHRQGGGKRYQDHYQRGHASDNAHGLPLPDRVPRNNMQGTHDA